MSILIDGKAVSAKKRTAIKEKTALLKEKGVTPGLAVIIVGDDPASKIYVRNKKKACEEVGFYSEEYALSADVEESEIASLIERLNADPKIHGILVQSPLPKKFNEKKLVEMICEEKDVDAFKNVSVGKITRGEKGFLPCTPAGIMELLREYDIDVCGKNAVVIGRSNIVGKPMALLLLAANATVTVCHSRTADLASFTRNADIVVSAVGKADFLCGNMIKDGAVVIDVGMNRNAEGKLSGDAVFAECEPKASYITPVPGGVGPMTITMLLANTLTSAENTLKQ